VWEGITLPPHGKITDLTSAEDQGTGEEPSGEQDEGATLRRHSTGAFYPAAQQQLRHHHQQASSWPMLTASKAQHWVVHALHQVGMQYVPKHTERKYKSLHALP
jgi:hypothetical protein